MQIQIKDGLKIKTKKTPKKITSSKDSLINIKVSRDKILEYCGYKLEGNKLVATNTNNPVPYQGL